MTDTPHRVWEYVSESLAKTKARMEIFGPAGYYHRESVNDYVDLGDFEEPGHFKCICGESFEYEGDFRTHVITEGHT